MSRHCRQMSRQFIHDVYGCLDDVYGCLAIVHMCLDDVDRCLDDVDRCLDECRQVSRQLDICLDS